MLACYHAMEAVALVHPAHWHYKSDIWGVALDKQPSSLVVPCTDVQSKVRPRIESSRANSIQERTVLGCGKDRSFLFLLGQ